MQDSKKRILIVDDDPLVSSLYRAKLEKEGYQVEIANDGQLGFYRIHEFKPHAVLLDLMLPQISGVDIIKKLRAQKAFQNLPIIVFSNVYVTSMINDAVQAGATKVFNKAEASPLQVVNCVRELLFPAAEGAGLSAPSASNLRPPGLPTAESGKTSFLTRPGASSGGTAFSFKNTLNRLTPPGTRSVPTAEPPSPNSVPGLQPLEKEEDLPSLPSLPTLMEDLPTPFGEVVEDARSGPPSSRTQKPLVALPGNLVSRPPSVIRPDGSVMPDDSELVSSNKAVPAASSESAMLAERAPAASTLPTSPTGTDSVSFQDDSEEFQASLREAYYAEVPSGLASLRKSILHLTKADNDSGRMDALQAIYKRIHSMTASAGMSGLAVTAQICSVLEAFLRELEQKPASLNASTFRTIAQAIDFLGVLFEKRALDLAREHAQPTALVVDDEMISRRAVVFALNKARITPIDTSDPYLALEKATSTKFDLIYLDVDMPGMNGFELCGKIRKTLTNKGTPVVFVTSLSDFENKARSTLSGGNDLIAKPFIFNELALKSVTYVMKGRILTK